MLVSYNKNSPVSSFETFSPHRDGHSKNIGVPTLSSSAPNSIHFPSSAKLHPAISPSVSLFGLLPSNSRVYIPPTGDVYRNYYNFVLRELFWQKVYTVSNITRPTVLYKYIQLVDFHNILGHCWVEGDDCCDQQSSSGHLTLSANHLPELNKKIMSCQGLVRWDRPQTATVDVAQ